MKLLETQQAITDSKSKLLTLQAEKQYLTNLCEEYLVNIARNQARTITMEKAIVILQAASSIGKAKIAEKFSSVIEDAITTITGQEHKVEIVLDTRGNDIEANIIIDGKEDVMNSFGGGIKDIISNTLRFLTLFMYKLESPMLLDEPTKQLSKRLYSDQIGRFFKEISKRTQLVVATHSEEVAALADNEIKVWLDGKESKITQKEIYNE